MTCLESIMEIGLKFSIEIQWMESPTAFGANKGLFLYRPGSVRTLTGIYSIRSLE